MPRLRSKGMRDFASFTDDDPDEKSTKVAVDARPRWTRRATCSCSGSKGPTSCGRWSAAWSASSSRSAAATLTARELDQFMREPSGVPARLTAPPSGLFLERVTYPGDPPMADAAPLLTLPSFGL